MPDRNFPPVRARRICLSVWLLLIFCWNTDAQTKPSDNRAPRLQSVKSCKILDLPLDALKNNFDPIGGYRVYGKSPAAPFAEFSSFTLDRVFVPNAAAAQSNRVVGGLVVNTGETSSETYQITALTVSNQTMQFSTEALNNVRYEFTGRFLKKGAFSRFNEKNVAVLKGTLKRFEADKLAAEADMQYKFVVWKVKIAVPGCESEFETASRFAAEKFH